MESPVGDLNALSEGNTPSPINPVGSLPLPRLISGLSGSRRLHGSYK